MRYILPLEKERQKYQFEKTSDGKELKNSNIVPIVNTDKDLINGIIYVESPFQYEKYFEITNFNQLSQDKWKEILQELASKIGAKKIITTLVSEKENSKKVSSNKEKEVNIGGECKFVEVDTSFKNSNSSQENVSNSLKSSLQFEIDLKGKKEPIEKVEKWIKDKKINLEDNMVFRILFDQFKNDNLCKYNETKRVEEIITGIHDVNNTLSAIANIKSPLFNANMQTTLSNNNQEEFRKYQKTEFILEIIFED